MVCANGNPQDLGGFDLYPERRRASTNFQSFMRFLDRDVLLSRTRCERNVQKCVENSLLVKTMLYALKSAGCEIDPKRHISCEPCHPNVTGGFDAEMNQIVVCQGQGDEQSTLAHEMLHMFDHCRAKLDWKNPEHVACSEIRAANLFHCSFMAAFVQGLASPMDYKAKHEMCVRHKAAKSVMVTNALTQEQADQAVDKVFPICYNDLEPIGRRLRYKSEDIEKSYKERFIFAAF